MAKFDAGDFKPVEVIMHPIPKGKAPDDGTDPIEYSEAPIALTTDDRTFIQRRLRSSLGGYARPVVVDPSLESPVPAMVVDLLASKSKLVKHSCAIAHALYAEQKWVSPGGLVMTVLGTVGAAKCLVIAKMEHQEGMRVEQVKNKAGQRTYRAEHLRDLILGDGTRVFKLGAFVERPDGSLSGHVVDDQQLYGGVANYFIHFLGCKFLQQADIQTETFLTQVQKFISQRTKDDPETNASYEIALLSEMQRATTKIEPEKFATEHLKNDDQEPFLQRLRDAGLSTKSFTKDTSLVKTRIRRMRIQTTRGADVFVPPEMFEDGSVTVTPGDENSVITVRDEVTNMTGASGKKVD